MKSYILLLGFIDYVLDNLEPTSDRLQIRNYLLSTIYAKLITQLLEFPELQSIVTKLNFQLDDGQSFLEQMQKFDNALSQANMTQVDLNQTFIRTSKEVIIQFVKTAKPKIISEMTTAIDKIFS